MSANDVQEIADDLRRAYDAEGTDVGEVLMRHFADKVEVVHEPPSVMDGFISRDTMQQHRTVEHAAFARVMPDFRETATVVVSGDDISVELTIAGTLLDGRAVAITIPAVYAIESGKIVRLTARVDAEATAPLRAALAESGFVPGASSGQTGTRADEI